MVALLKDAVLVVLVGVLAGLFVNGLRPTGGLDLTASFRAPDSCSGVDWTTAEEAAAALENGHRPLIVDAREPRHYEDAHIVGALSVPFREGDTLPDWLLERVGRADSVLAYCDASGDCARSTKLAEALLESGAARGVIAVLQGGWPAWEAQNLPAEGGPCPHCR